MLILFSSVLVSSLEFKSKVNVLVRVESSAYNIIFKKSVEQERSLIYMLKRSGPSIVP